ncbi:MAG TPA: hypothetical protein VM577_06830 [Anaerovoracaceae bacterium]|nr:hypothetical protein [Anaerovoracaceae bacterium]
MNIIKIKLYTTDKMHYTFDQETFDDAAMAKEYVLSNLIALQELLTKEKFIMVDDPEYVLLNTSRIARVYYEEKELTASPTPQGRLVEDYDPALIGFEPACDDPLDY